MELDSALRAKLVHSITIQVLQRTNKFCSKLVFIWTVCPTLSSNARFYRQPNQEFYKKSIAPLSIFKSFLAREDGAIGRSFRHKREEMFYRKSYNVTLQILFINEFEA